MAATAPKANQAHFHFICGDLDKSTFEVLEFTGVERISMPYEFKISLISRNDSIDLETVIYKPGTLYIGEETNLYPYSGVVIEFRLLDKNTDFSTYQAILVSKLWLTNMNNQSRIMVQKTLSDSIKEVLATANVKKINFDEGTIKNNTNFEYLVQYQESDFAFINRLMEDAGIWYFFEEQPLQTTDKSEETLVITGSSSAFQNISGQAGIPYKEVSGLDGDICINHLQYERRVISKGVFVKNYNYRDPSTDLADKGQTEKGSAGTVYEYGGPNKDATAVHDAVEILANRINSNAIELSGTSNCARFKTGYRFTVKEHFRDDIKDQEFVLTAVTHSGNHLSGIATYRNKFSCIPSALASNYAPEKKTVVPRVPGLLTAKIEADGSDYATLDDKGRYKVKMHFDLAQTSNLGASKYVRLAQPYSGAQYGMHFPSHKDTEMLIACIDGDPNKPVGIGTIPNANTLSPVVSGNKQQNIIRTAGGNELLMDDTDSKQKVHLVSKAQNLFEMDDEHKKITTQSTDKNSIVIDDTNKIVQIVSKKHIISLSYADDTNITIKTEKGNMIILDDQNQNISVKTKGGHAIKMDDQGKKITLADGQGKSTVTLDGNSGLILDTKGKISINAVQDIEIQGANVKMSASTGKIDVKATQDLSLSGLNINEKANVAVKIEGVQLEAKGTASVKMQGAMVEVKADASLKASGGAMAEISGGAMTTVKGAIVMIN